MTMKKTVEFAVGLSFVAMCGLTVFLLYTHQFFAVDQLNAVVFGTAGAVLEGTFYNYQELQQTCGPAAVLAAYCDFLPGLEAAGQAFRGFLFVDLGVLVLSVVEAVSLRVSLKTLVASLTAGGPVAGRWLCLAKAAIWGRYLLVLHPLVLLGGLVTWTLAGRLDELPGQVQLRIGFMCVVLQIFFSAARFRRLELEMYCM